MSIQNTIESLEKRLKEAKERARKIDTRKRLADAKAERTKDTRRKVLVGAIVLKMCDEGRFPKDTLMKALDAQLKRPDERALFELDSAPSRPAAAAAGDGDAR